MEIRTLDYHTGGEPLRIVTAGLPEIPGDTMLERRRYMQCEMDHYRHFLMLEPRGHGDMYGAVLTPPVTQDGDVGVLFLHNEGYSTMCGHGIIALVTAGIEHRLFDMNDTSAVRVDTPAGRVTACARLGPSGKVDSVSFVNVPSFVLDGIQTVHIGDRAVDCTIAFGGAFYAYVDAESLGLELAPAEADELIRIGRRIKQEVSRQCDIQHPQGADELNFLYGVIFVRGAAGPDFPAIPSRNVCVFADGELDRSPTGTGVSGRAAIHYFRGEIGMNQAITIESIIGSTFEVRCIEETLVGGCKAVIPEVTGSAWISGRHTFIFDERDPLRQGFLIR